MTTLATPLTGTHVTLELLDKHHEGALRLAADDARIWQHTVTAANGPGFDAWFAEALATRDSGPDVPFVVRLRSTSRLVGSTRFLSPVERHRRVEIGSTWYHPDVWSSAVNPECKLLLLRHAFDTWRANRVELKTDSLNVRSQAAIAKLGALREGVLRAHMIVQGGRIRDTVVFGITRAEWPDVRAGLERRIASAVPRG